jgi:hypothetical protein
MSQVQLFARNGEFVETVAIERASEIVVWRGKYYALQSGRYVECACIEGEIIKETQRPLTKMVETEIRRL